MRNSALILLQLKFIKWRLAKRHNIARKNRSQQNVHICGGMIMPVSEKFDTDRQYACKNKRILS